MSVLATDNFNRADANPIGGNWTTITGEGALKLVSNAVGTASATDADSGAYYNAVTWPNDQYCKIKVSTVGAAANDGGPHVRTASGAWTFYQYNNNFNTFHKLYKAVNGTWTQIQQVNTTNWAVGDVIYIEIQGTNLITKVNSTTIHTASDSAIASGSVGMGLFDSALRFDDFEGGDFASPQDTPELYGRPVGLKGQRLMQQLLAMKGLVWNPKSKLWLPRNSTPLVKVDLTRRYLGALAAQLP